MKNIFIVEDEINQQEAYKLKLKDTYELNFAQTASEVFTLLQNYKPDLIILDIMLPGGKNGFDILMDLKADPRTASIPVIMLTNLGDEQKETAISYGCNEYLNKTQIGPQELFNIVEKYV